MIARLVAMIQSRVPLALAGFFSVPIFFCSLMCASLALDRPHVVGLKEFPSSSGTEAKIWAVALIPSGILLLIGVLAMLVPRFGVWIVLAASTALCLLLPIRVDTWITRHAHRFPFGMDYLNDSSPSNTSSKGEWEQTAKDTVIGMTHWTLILLGLGAAVTLALYFRRREAVPAPPPLGGVHAPDVTPPSLT